MIITNFLIRIPEDFDVKYKNIVFDFGNVIGRFDPNYILEHYVHSTEDFSTLLFITSNFSEAACLRIEQALACAY